MSNRYHISWKIIGKNLQSDVDVSMLDSLFVASMMFHSDESVSFYLKFFTGTPGSIYHCPEFAKYSKYFCFFFETLVNQLCIIKNNKDEKKDIVD